LVIVRDAIAIQIVRGLQELVLADVEYLFKPIIGVLELFEQLVELLLLRTEDIVTQLVLSKILLIVI